MCPVRLRAVGTVTTQEYGFALASLVLLGVVSFSCCISVSLSGSACDLRGVCAQYSGSVTLFAFISTAAPERKKDCALPEHIFHASSINAF